MGCLNSQSRTRQGAVHASTCQNPPYPSTSQTHSGKTLKVPQNLDTTQEKGEGPEMTERTSTD